MGIDVGVGNFGEQGLKEVSEGDFTDPAEGEACDGDAELDGVEYLVEIGVEALDCARADPLGIDELLDAGVANADEGEFCRNKEGIERHKQHDCDQPQQHVGKHRQIVASVPTVKAGVCPAGILDCCLQFQALPRAIGQLSGLLFAAGKV